MPATAEGTAQANGALDRDTIAAVATGAAAGGIGIVRLSGTHARAFGEVIAGAPLVPRQAHYREFTDSEGQVIDDGIAIYFPGPNSFTGEDVVELQGHGGQLVLTLLLERTLALGARQARPGEFSERAFLNGRIDLTQAEAIADLINARTRTAARQAQASLKGAFSMKISRLIEKMVALRVYVEAAIDFPEEEIDFLGDGEVSQRLDALRTELEQLTRDARAGAIIRNGATVTLAGKPNSGKSSLLNRLAGEDVAIVTEIPGTTRDIVRQQLDIAGIPITISDTAGIRQTEDAIELEGVRRAKREIETADLILHLIDDTDLHPPALIASDSPVIRVYNKIDLSGRESGPNPSEPLTVAISTLTGDGLDSLRQMVAHQLGLGSDQETHFSARERHLAILNSVQRGLIESQQRFLSSGAGELLAEDLRYLHDDLGGITGRMSSDELLGEIFSSFCIGK